MEPSRDGYVELNGVRTWYAEYGEFCPSAISLTGRSRTKSNPAPSSQVAKRTRSGISPIPQLPLEGIEKSGTNTPA